MASYLRFKECTYIDKVTVELIDLLGNLGASDLGALSDLLEDSLAQEDELLVLLVVFLVGALLQHVLHILGSLPPTVREKGQLRIGLKIGQRIYFNSFKAKLLLGVKIASLPARGSSCLIWAHSDLPIEVKTQMVLFTGYELRCRQIEYEGEILSFKIN